MHKVIGFHTDILICDLIICVAKNLVLHKFTHGNISKFSTTFQKGYVTLLGIYNTFLYIAAANKFSGFVAQQQDSTYKSHTGIHNLTNPETHTTNLETQTQQFFLAGLQTFKFTSI